MYKVIEKQHGIAHRRQFSTILKLTELAESQEFLKLQAQTQNMIKLILNWYIKFEIFLKRL